VSRRSRPRIETRTGRYGEDRAGRWSSPWVIRVVVIVAVAILVTAVVYAALHGILFSLPKR
jgi:anti-sigma-K factor RskA